MSFGAIAPMSAAETSVFSVFWAAWPKKVKRAQAQDAFRWAMAHHNADGQLLERMLTTIAWQIRFYSEAKYLPDPNRWLLDCRWEDEEPLPAQVAPTARERADYRQWVTAVGTALRDRPTLEQWVSRQRRSA